VEKGYLDLPTSVNNVETLCCAARIMEKGAAWFAGFGTKDSAGTKLFSVSGDCARPGVYELPFGISLNELLKEVGGEGAQAMLVGGPSGQFVAAKDFEKKVAFESLATGGSMVVFGKDRDLLSLASDYMHFFVEESCGYCVPCRVGNVLLTKKLDEIRAGKGLPEDLKYLEDLCVSVKKSSRCGLGQTSPNPIYTTLSNFRALYEAKLGKPNGLVPTFDLNAALAEAAKIQGRAPIFHED
jgi:[NiFe] hydrogenase diaphorase moiety large subunit